MTTVICEQNLPLCFSPRDYSHPIVNAVVYNHCDPNVSPYHKSESWTLLLIHKHWVLTLCWVFGAMNAGERIETNQISSLVGLHVEWCEIVPTAEVMGSLCVPRSYSIG